LSGLLFWSVAVANQPKSREVDRAMITPMLAPKERTLFDPRKGYLTYGHHTKLAWKVLKAVKSGTFEELKDHGVKSGWMEKDDVRMHDALRMALYGMVRRQAINSTPGEGETKTVFTMK
jgi:hypothetical protein